MFLPDLELFENGFNGLVVVCTIRVCATDVVSCDNVTDDV